MILVIAKSKCQAFVFNDCAKVESAEWLSPRNTYLILYFILSLQNYQVKALQGKIIII